MKPRFSWATVFLVVFGVAGDAVSQQRPRLRIRAAVLQPTQADVKYGPHRRNVLDFWQAQSDRPTPLLVSIHGGGFRGGNKSVNAELLRQCLDAKISVAAITYRLSDEAIAPAQFHDAARAIQFLRSQSKAWNIDPERFAATGGSAGAGLSLWLGFHDDLADPDSEDPVLRQSTRLSCMVVHNGQTSYDPRFIRDLFPGTDTYKESALAQLYDVDLNNLDDLPVEKYKLFEYVSPINHLTKDDAPAMLVYGSPVDAKITSRGVGIHHPKFGVTLLERMDALGIRCEVVAAGKRVGGGEPTSAIDFLTQHLLRGGDQAQLEKVEGKVTRDGLPLEGATIKFIAQDGTVASGVTNAKGGFSLGDGVRPGKFTVTIDKIGEPDDAADDRRKNKGAVPPKYASPTQSGLQVEVVEAENQINIDLKSK